jgi:putative Mn2+ efflux pump MntP
VLWLSAVLIAAVSNLDNLAAGVAFGMRDTRIAAAPNVVIAVVTMAATAGAMTFGHVLSRVLPPSLAAALGASIISAIGVWTVLASLQLCGCRPVRLRREAAASGAVDICWAARSSERRSSPAAKRSCSELRSPSIMLRPG